MEQAVIIKKGKGLNALYRNYRHKKDRSFKNKQYWRCVNKSCPARLHTSNDCEANVPADVLHFTDHDHMPDEEDVVATKIKADVCNLAKNELLQPLSSIFKDYVTRNNVPRNDVILPAFQSCSSQMHRARRTQMPPVLTTIAEIDLQGHWSQTRAGDPFLLSQDDDIIIFATDANLQILSQSSALFMDGTFKAAPRLFTQLFTIHTVYRDHFVPLVYCLLPNKQRTTYYARLETIKRKNGRHSSPVKSGQCYVRL